MIRLEEIIPVGKFQKTHALKGELNMISDIDPQYFLEGKPMIIENDGIMVPYFVDTVRQKGSTSYLVKISGIESEEEASIFVNKEINILKKDAEDWLPEEIEKESGLIGFKVIDISDDTLIGEIVDVEDSNVNVLFIVETQAGDEVFIPATEDFIEEIDEEKGVIKMKIPDGLLHINSKD